MGVDIFQNFVSPSLEHWLKSSFEDVCRDFLALEKEMGTAPFTFEQIGMWWGQHPTKKRTEYVSVSYTHLDVYKRQN